MIKITFPDGSVREYEVGVTGLQIAESISQRLAQDVLACGVNGETVELNRPIHEDAAVVLYKWDDAEAKHAFWHTSAHLMAEALQELYPGIQFGIGPAIENGFYYDVMPPEGTVIREGDFAAIEKKMLELSQRKEAVVRAEISKTDALKFFGDHGQTYKMELIEDLEDGHISTYTQGAFTDLCRGPHLLNTGAIKAVKVTAVSSAYWRGDEKRPQLTRIYGISFPKKKMLDEYLALLEGVLKEDRGRVHTMIGRDPKDRLKMAVVRSGGREAITDFDVAERFSAHTLVHFVLQTGRTHQIRVHAKYLGHPVVGDRVYGYKKQRFSLDGQLLHAEKLTLTHPRTGEVMQFFAPLPEDFQHVLAVLRREKGGSNANSHR